MDTENIKVLTLNCWGVFPPLFCVKRRDRLAAVGEKLSHGEYDIILFQELYIPNDYNRMKEALKHTYPFSNYYHSMMFGSGCAIFTKFTINQSFFFPYTLNGFSHNVEHGDYYAGKGIGLVILETAAQFILHVYVTHTHARYHTIKSDNYNIHRLNQSIELAQFINITSRGSDAVIVGGDFNMDSEMLGLKLILSTNGLKDSWLTQNKVPENPEITGTTSCRPDNAFCCKKWLKMHEHGERLDYILYKQCKGIQLKCEYSKLAMRRIPSMPHLNYSDHEGFEASFVISRDSKAIEDTINKSQLAVLCNKCTLELNTYCRTFKSHQYLRVFVLFCLFLSILIDLPQLIFWSISGLSFPGILSRPIIMVISIVFFLLLWYTCVTKTAEQKAIYNSLQSLNWLLLNNSAKMTNGHLSSGH